MSTPETITTVSTKDGLHHALPLLLEVFMEDPSWTGYYPDRATRKRALTRYYRKALNNAFAHGAVDTLVSGERIVAVALWDAPYPATLWRRVVTKLTGQKPDTPSWHLEGIVVYPEGRGRGYGTKLLEHGLARADRDNETTTLEATSPASKRLYERHGFQALTDTGFSPGQREIEMLRNPAQAA